jgi:hypothetical protein
MEVVATSLLRRLEDEGLFTIYNEIYFITHSMGGLVTKRMLAELNRPNQIEKLRKVKAVLYIAVPSQGTSVAKIGEIIGNNVQFNEMRSSKINSYLQILENQWQNLIRDRKDERFPQSYCAYELHDTNGVRVVDLVDASTFCDQTPFSVRADHFDIVKPENDQADIYRWARSRIKEASDLARDHKPKAAREMGSEPIVTGFEFYRNAEPRPEVVFTDGSLQRHTDRNVLVAYVGARNNTESKVTDVRIESITLGGASSKSWFPIRFADMEPMQGFSVGGGAEFSASMFPKGGVFELIANGSYKKDEGGYKVMKKFTGRATVNVP